MIRKTPRFLKNLHVTEANKLKTGSLTLQIWKVLCISSASICYLCTELIYFYVARNVYPFSISDYLFDCDNGSQFYGLESFLCNWQIWATVTLSAILPFSPILVILYISLCYYQLRVSNKIGSCLKNVSKKGDVDINFERGSNLVVAFFACISVRCLVVTRRTERGLQNSMRSISQIRLLSTLSKTLNGSQPTLILNNRAASTNACISGEWWP